MARYAAVLGVLLAFVPLPAPAQQRVVVVPADADVVIAARGQPQPRPGLTAAPSPRALSRSRAAPPRSPGWDEIMGMPALPLLPLVAAGIVAATLGGSAGQSGAAPARTR